ncbi:hypothetical protein [Natronobacterium texcoconense]|uniref:Uncharacterized protein n=1 Tax=Natronobacterium texcoconense TaxID=1095778 RepID=A0A1H1IKY6_NATTX|nr:hypothetical protein [Natronobacterium texcoconense]SDR37956.1 hypothetical protein SAMN04489842_3557 [Natronobacterium texcoconense]
MGDDDRHDCGREVDRFEDLEPGAGCTEIWEYLAEKRSEADEETDCETSTQRDSPR